MRNPQPPNPPAAHTVAIAQQIRRDFGFGGANFPGAEELYAAATKIEAWAWATAPAPPNKAKEN